MPTIERVNTGACGAWVVLTFSSQSRKTGPKTYSHTLFLSDSSVSVQVPYMALYK